MRYHVAHSVYHAPCRVQELSNVRAEIAHHELVLGFLNTVLLAVRIVLVNGEHLIQQLVQFFISDFGICQLVRILRQLIHVRIGHFQAHTRFLHLVVDVSNMFGRPASHSRIERQIQCVIAHHTDRCHAHADRTASIVRVGETQVRLHIIAHDLLSRHPRQQPDFFAILEATSSFIANIAANQLVGKAERLRILHDLIAVRHNTKDSAVRTADICLEVFNLSSAAHLNIALLDLPIQAGQPQCVSTGGRFLNASTKAVPGLLTNIKHSLNICCHFLFPPKFWL